MITVLGGSGQKTSKQRDSCCTPKGTMGGLTTFSQPRLDSYYVSIDGKGYCIIGIRLKGWDCFLCSDISIFIDLRGHFKTSHERSIVLWTCSHNSG